jgi:hypothetical protein
MVAWIDYRGGAYNRRSMNAREVWPGKKTLRNCVGLSGSTDIDDKALPYALPVDVIIPARLRHLTHEIA